MQAVAVNLPHGDRLELDIQPMAKGTAREKQQQVIKKGLYHQIGPSPARQSSQAG